MEAVDGNRTDELTFVVREMAREMFRDEMLYGHTYTPEDNAKIDD